MTERRHGVFVGAGWAGAAGCVAPVFAIGVFATGVFAAGLRITVET